MMVFYKKHIDYVSDHATDADARRYLIKGEGPRHFLDLDHYGGFPFSGLPRRASDARMLMTAISGVTKSGDTTQILGFNLVKCFVHSNGRLDSVSSLITGKQLPLRALRNFWYGLQPKDLVDEIYSVVVTDSIKEQMSELGFARYSELLINTETFGEHGSLPWNLQGQYQKLVTAFRTGNAELILKYSADIGHYIGDAHVPLHTVSNYNGQKTNQQGIHAFWESRIPELFADADYDYFVGQPTLFTNPDSMFWEMAFESHRHADTVLSIEKMLRISFPQQEQMCPDVRAQKQILTQCRNYAKAYEVAMNGLVERRMREAILALSSVWYSAWVEAGSPDLSKLTDWKPNEKELEEWKALQRASTTGKMIGRGEE